MKRIRNFFKSIYLLIISILFPSFKNQFAYANCLRYESRRAEKARLALQHYARSEDEWKKIEEIARPGCPLERVAKNVLATRF